MRNARTTRRRGVTVGLAAALTLLVALIVAGCGGGDSSSSSSGSTSGGGSSEESSGGSSGGAKLSVVGYSTPESVYAESLEPAFEAAAQHLRMRAWMGRPVSRQPIIATADR